MHSYTILLANRSGSQSLMPFYHVCMHLTNFELNRHSEDFVVGESNHDFGSGSKRSLKWLLGHISREHGEQESKNLFYRLEALGGVPPP